VYVQIPGNVICRMHAVVFSFVFSVCSIGTMLLSSCLICTSLTCYLLVAVIFFWQLTFPVVKIVTI